MDCKLGAKQAARSGARKGKDRASHAERPVLRDCIRADRGRQPPTGEAAPRLGVLAT